MKLLKTESPYLTKTQWRKVFLAASIITISLYIVAMIFSLCGSSYFILSYQNETMDNIENFFRSNNIFSLINCAFLTLEFYIVLSFVLQKRASIIYPSIFYLSLVIPAFFIDFPDFYYSVIPFVFHLIIPIIDQIIQNRKESSKKFSWKSYLYSLSRIGIAILVTLALQAMLFVIKAGYFDGQNHRQPLSGAFVYAIATDKAERQAARIQQLELNQALQGVVRYPSSMTYAYNANPFCGCGFNGNI